MNIEFYIELRIDQTIFNTLITLIFFNSWALNFLNEITISNSVIGTATP